MKRAQNPEVAIRRCSTKQVFLKISQMCWSLFCNKVEGQTCELIERETLVQVFCCEFSSGRMILKISPLFVETLFTENK